MSTITTVAIGTNRYAPAGSDAITLYTTEGAEKLTLGQLVVSACMRSAAAYESQSVLRMNSMTAGSGKLNDAAKWLSSIANGTADWGAAKNFLTKTMGIESSSLPSDLASFTNRLRAADALRNKMDALAKSQQEEMVDLQSLVNRRDVAHSTSSNVLRTLATSTSSNAANFA